MRDKVVLVTGAGRRVGAAICRALHAAGANVMIHHHASAADARALREELNTRRPDSADLAQADLIDVASLPAMVQQTVRRFGRLDALVNNASSFFATNVGEIDEKAWNNLVGTNLKGPLFLSQAAAPQLKKTHGCIVNIADIHGDRPLKGYLVYSVAKAGLVSLTKALARELAPDVRVNAVAPGTILWPEDGSFDEPSRQHIISHTLLKRAGEPDDIARAVRFLIAEAPYVTGQVLAVDGGRNIHI